MHVTHRLQRISGTTLHCSVHGDVLRYPGFVGTVVLHQYVLSLPLHSTSADRFQASYSNATFPGNVVSKYFLCLMNGCSIVGAIL